MGRSGCEREKVGGGCGLRRGGGGGKGCGGCGSQVNCVDHGLEDSA